MIVTNQVTQKHLIQYCAHFTLTIENIDSLMILIRVMMILDTRSGLLFRTTMYSSVVFCYFMALYSHVYFSCIYFYLLNSTH